MIIGIDEVGRGPIAGPVCVAAFAICEPRAQFLKHVRVLMKRHKLPLRDSKKLTAKHREMWHALLRDLQREGKCDFAISLVSAKGIDARGIAPSIRRALATSLMQLQPKATDTILLDGGLKAPIEFTRQKTIIKGDEKEIAISFASIVAKVHRDRLMVRLSKKYAHYGFEKHVGYGTKAHYLAIQKHGISPMHRKSFLGK